MTAIIVTLIICISVIICIRTYYNSKKPQNNCNHQLKIEKTWNGTYCNEYLSTCTKCGYQQSYKASGLN